MTEHFADALTAECAAKGSVVCVGLDPMPEFFPPDLRAKFGLDGIKGTSSTRSGGDLRDEVDAVFEFCTGVLDAVAEHAACVKIQSAYFERLHVAGVELYYSLVQEAAERGLLVIGDVKRGDIGTTSAAYAEAHLREIDEQLGDGEWRTPDAITVSAFMGLDTIDPFVKEAAALGKGLFVLVRTSNPGSALLQDAALADGRTVSEALADALAVVAEQYTGAEGYSLIGAVVGATQAHTMASLRKRLPKSIFLLPGYGAQGATAAMTREAFVSKPVPNGPTTPRGAIVSASRSVIYAYREPKFAGRGDWRGCVGTAAREMKEELRQILR